MMKQEIITFDKNSKKEILDMFGKTTDSEGYLVDKDNTEKRVTDCGRPIHIDEFAGVMKGLHGNPIFIKGDLPSLIELSDKLKKEE
jgi:hypothetical protein